MSKAVDATNELYLRNGKLWPYSPSLLIYRCPADQTTLKLGVKSVIRVRSYSLSGQMGSDVNTASSPPLHKEVEIVNPSSSRALTFIDERADTIDDGLFAMTDTKRTWQNGVSIWHLRGCTMSFADGHAEHWRWFEKTTFDAKGYFANVTSPVDRDYDRLLKSYVATK
jgi:prepilin-type processing-associated H-X9-DG protein